MSSYRIAETLGGHCRTRLRTPITQRFGNVQAAHGVGAIEIGESTGHTQRAMPGAGREAEPFCRPGEEGAAFGIGLGNGGQKRTVGVGVAARL